VVSGRILDRSRAEWSGWALRERLERRGCTGSIADGDHRSPAAAGAALTRPRQPIFSMSIGNCWAEHGSEPHEQYKGIAGIKRLAGELFSPRSRLELAYRIALYISGAASKYSDQPVSALSSQRIVYSNIIFGSSPPPCLAPGTLPVAVEHSGAIQAQRRTLWLLTPIRFELRHQWQSPARP